MSKGIRGDILFKILEYPETKKTITLELTEKQHYAVKEVLKQF